MYAQQDPNASPGGGVYSPSGTYAPPQAAAPYMGPAYSPSQPGLASPPMYGSQPYAAVPYAQPAMSPMTPYDSAYASYMYGLQAPQRQYLIQAPPRRKGVFTTDNILTVLMVGGTLVLAVFALLLVVTVVVPKITRKQHSGHRRRHEFPAEYDNREYTPPNPERMRNGFTDAMISMSRFSNYTMTAQQVAHPEQPVDAPQVSEFTKEELTESKLNAAGTERGSKHERKILQTARHTKRLAKA